MAQGYAAIARQHSADGQVAGNEELEAAIAALRKIDTDDSRFYAQQLESVSKFFAKRAQAESTP